MWINTFAVHSEQDIDSYCIDLHCHSHTGHGVVTVGHHIAYHGSNRRSLDAHIQPQNHDRVQNNIGNASGNVADHRIAGCTFVSIKDKPDTK